MRILLILDDVKKWVGGINWILLTPIFFEQKFKFFLDIKIINRFPISFLLCTADEINCDKYNWKYQCQYQSNKCIEFHISNFANANCSCFLTFIFQFSINSACYNTWKFVEAGLLRVYGFCYIKVSIPTRTVKMTFVYLLVIRPKRLRL